MTPSETFIKWAPEILLEIENGGVRYIEYLRHALAGFDPWDFPIGLKVDAALIGVMPKKLESINFWMSDWRRRSHLRKTWTTQLWQVVCRAERVAAAEHLVAVGRAPHCAEKMAVQVVRLVGSVREFIKDDDDLMGSPKQLYDAMKDVKLIREDRREWLTMAPPVQDVSPIGIPLTVFILRPVEAGLFPRVMPSVARSVERATAPAQPSSRVEDDREGRGRKSRYARSID